MPKRIQSEPMRLRKSAGLSQQDLADALSVDRTMISYWENGHREPHLTPGQWKTYANLLGVTIQQIVEEYLKLASHTCHDDIATSSRAAEKGGSYS
jgi:transcriptional regulator with XRE-family HTH domain